MVKKILILMVLISVYACAQRYSSPSSYTPFLGLRNYAVGANPGNGINLNNQTIDTWADQTDTRLDDLEAKPVDAMITVNDADSLGSRPASDYSLKTDTIYVYQAIALKASLTITDSLASDIAALPTVAETKAFISDSIASKVDKDFAGYDKVIPEGTDLIILNQGSVIKNATLADMPISTKTQTELTSKSSVLTVSSIQAELYRIRDSLYALIKGITPITPDPVSNLAITAYDGKLIISYTKPANSDSIWVQRNYGSGYITLDYTTASSYTDSSLTNGTAYTYIIRNYYDNSISAGVTITGTPNPPPLYLTISPLSISFDEYSLDNSDSVIIDAETSDLNSGSTLSNLSVNRVDSAASTGTYGYDFEVTSNGGFGNYYKTVSGDTIIVECTFTIPYNYVGIGTTNIISVLRLSNSDESNNSGVIANMMIRGSATNPTFYRYQYRSATTTVTTVTPSAITLTRGSAYTFKISFVRNSDGSLLDYKFYVGEDSVGGADSVAGVGSPYNLVDRMKYGVIAINSGTTTSGQHLFADDIYVYGNTNLVTTSDSKTATVTISNNTSSSIIIGDLYLPSAPFTIGTLAEATSINADDSITVNVVFDYNYPAGLYVDTLGLSTAYENKYILLSGTTNGSSVIDTSGITLADYYFDPVNGNDNNSGTSPTDAWKTATKFNTTTFTAGDTIAFRDSMTYKGYFELTEDGTSGNEIVVTNWYGSSSGQLPFIEGAGATQLSNWTLTSGYSDVWQTSIGGFYSLWFIKGDSTRWGVQYTSLADLTAEYRAYVNGSILYVYSPSNPATYYDKVVYDYGDEQSLTASCFTVSGEYIKIENLSMGYTRGKALKFMYGSDYSEADNVTVSYCGRASRIDVVAEGGDGIYVSSSNITVKNCTAYECTGHGFYTWGSSSGTISNIVYDGNTAYNNHHTIGFDVNSQTGNVRDVTIKNNLIYSTVRTWWANYGLYNGLNLTGAGSMGNFIKGESAGLVKKVYFYNNIVIDAIAPSIQVESNSDSVYIYSNTFINLDSAGAYTSGYPQNWTMYGTSNTPGTLHFVNNISVTSWTNPTNYPVRAYNNAVTTNNLVYRLDGGTYLVYGYDVPAGLRLNPDFVNINGLTKESFQLQSSSPAINAGATLGSPYNVDILGVSRPVGEYSIGAYQYVAP